MNSRPRIAAAWNPRFNGGILGTIFGDNKTVLTDYAKNKYGFRDLFVKGPAFESSFHTDTLEAFTKMVEDYNK